MIKKLTKTKNRKMEKRKWKKKNVIKKASQQVGASIERAAMSASNDIAHTVKQLVSRKEYSLVPLRGIN